MKTSAAERREREKRRERRGHAGGQKAGRRQSDKKDEEQGEFREGGFDRRGGGVITGGTGRESVSIERPPVDSIRHVHQQQRWQRRPRTRNINDVSAP